MCAECEHSLSHHEYREDGIGCCVMCGCRMHAYQTHDGKFRSDLAELRRLAQAVLTHPRLAERMSADIAAVADMMDDLKVADE